MDLLCLVKLIFERGRLLTAGGDLLRAFSVGDLLRGSGLLPAGARGNTRSGCGGEWPLDQIFPKKAPPSASVSYPTVPRGEHVADLNPSVSVNFGPKRTPTA